MPNSAKKNPPMIKVRPSGEINADNTGSLGLLYIRGQEREREGNLKGESRENQVLNGDTDFLADIAKISQVNSVRLIYDD